MYCVVYGPFVVYWLELISIISFLCSLDNYKFIFKRKYQSELLYEEFHMYIKWTGPVIFHYHYNTTTKLAGSVPNGLSRQDWISLKFM